MKTAKGGGEVLKGENKPEQTPRKGEEGGGDLVGFCSGSGLVAAPSIFLPSRALNANGFIKKSSSFPPFSLLFPFSFLLGGPGMVFAPPPSPLNRLSCKVKILT